MGIDSFERTRLKMLGGVFLLFIVVILGRLFYWQVIRADDLAATARGQQRSGGKLEAERGGILDAGEDWLVVSKRTWLVFMDMNHFSGNPRQVANLLAPLFLVDIVEEDTYEELLLEEAIRVEKLLTREDVSWVPLKHRVDSEVMRNIDALGIRGLGFDIEESRYYPEASSAAQVLGFLGKDDEGTDKGYFGLEGYYDLSLSGKPGFNFGENDAKGAPILFGSTKEVTAVGGVDLVTHIDKAIQRMVEEGLEDAIERYGASAGTVIVMDPADGAIKGLASYPTFDPIEYYEYSDELFRNPAISDSFEPGSIFKPLVVAAGLDAGVIKPDTKCDICDGPVKVDKYEIGTWNDEYRPDSTVTDVIVHSDNVGMVFVGEKLGKDKLYDYLESYGFGAVTGVDLQGESSPRMRERDTWNVVDQATATFGQGIAVTPLQMVRAISVIANGGKIVTPQVVDKLRVGGRTQDIKPQVGKRVLSRKATTEVTEMMVKAVEEGESKWIQSRGFEVAGKTGTAQIPVKGHYDDEKTIVSFIGFAPAKKAKFIMLVTLREPQTSPWASETAAPTWFSIASGLFPYLKIQPKR